MFCPYCGSAKREGSPLCSSCGRPLSSTVSLLTSSSTPRRWDKRFRKSGWVAIILVCASLLLALLSYNSSTNKNTAGKTAPSAGLANTQPQTVPVEKQIVGTIFATGLIKDPFTNRGNLVILDVWRIKRYVGDNDVGVEEPRGGMLTNVIGVQFDRMLSENIALYKVMATHAFSIGDGGIRTMEGQFVVIGSKPSTNERYWVVEPLGTIDGTNGFGAEISIPAIRFDRYSNENKKCDKSGPPGHQVEVCTYGEN